MATTGWRPEWARIVDPFARFKTMGDALRAYTSPRLGEMPMAWDESGAWGDRAQREQALQAEWLQTLSPQERAQWDADTAFSAAQNKRHMNTGMGITGGLIGLGAGSMLAGGLGLLGSGAPAGGGVELGTAAATPADMLMGATPEMVGASAVTPEVAAGTAVGAGGATTGLSGTGATGAPSLIKGIGGFGGLANDALKGIGGLSGLAGLGSLAGGLVGSARPPATATAPDYLALAREQARLNQEAAGAQTVANRPNQIDAAGNQLTWTQDPKTGQWTQRVTLSPEADALRTQRNDLLGMYGDQIQSQGAFNPNLGPTMDPRGNVQEVSDAWMALMQPYRERARNTEMQRLANMGLPMNSAAYQRSLSTLEEGDTDAQNKAIIQGLGEYNNVFNRNLANRQSLFNEYTTAYGQPLKGFMGLAATPQSQTSFEGFTPATGYSPAQIYGAGQDQYTANLSSANATNAARNNLNQGLIGLGSQLLKGGWGT